MLSFSYHLSPSLFSSLEQINILRQEILLAPLPPKTELRYKWDALIDKTYHSLQLKGGSLSRVDIVAILTNPNRKKLSATEKDVHRYRYAFDYIYKEWYGSKKPITVKTILYLHQLVGKGDIKEEVSTKTLLTFMETSKEHPILQAGIVLIELIYAAPFQHDNDRIALLLSYVFLYKQGYDMHGLLVLEEYFKQDTARYEGLVKTATESGNITPWLEYIANGVVTQLLKLKKKMIEQTTETYMSAKLFDLTERQQAILSFLEKPGSRITNKKCTVLFSISQITSSRELAKLTALGVLFAHGRGRSVYYTKV